MKKISLLFVILLISACASRQESVAIDCDANWQHMGYQQGLDGQAKNNLEQEKLSCLAKDKKIDYQQYVEGWEEGAHLYCTPSYQQGHADAKQGKTQANFTKQRKQCVHIGMRFKDSAYQLGYRIGKKEKNSKSP